MSTGPVNYADNVFINCPFDKSYQMMFEATVFAIHDCGFIARCAREENDSGDVRLMKIVKIIDECKYGIHDISKADIDADSGLARFNMPFELGLFMGANRYAARKTYNSDKKTLVLDSERYRYQKFLSDIGGQDISSHEDKPEKLINSIRDFLLVNSRRKTIPGGQFIVERFEKFSNELPGICNAAKWNRNKLTFIEYAICVTEWIAANPI